MSEETKRRDPAPGEVWQDRRGKKRLVVGVHPPGHYGEALVVWEHVGKHTGPMRGSMVMEGWHRRGWRLVEQG
jgi:hypothetical protein